MTSWVRMSWQQFKLWLYSIFSESNPSQLKSSDKPKVENLNSSMSSSASSQLDKRYRCDICQVISSSRTDYESHMAGKRHRENEARYSQEPRIRPKLDPSPVTNFVERALGSRKRSSGVSKLTCENNNNKWWEKLFEEADSLEICTS